MTIKLYDERDLDYYNPKPYLSKLLKLLDKEAQNHISWMLDDSGYDNLFEYPEDFTGEKDTWGSKRHRVLKKDVLDLLQPEQFDNFVNRIFQRLDHDAGRLEQKIKELKEIIDSNLEHLANIEVAKKEKEAYIAEQREKLDNYLKILEEYGQPKSNT